MGARENGVQIAVLHYLAGLCLQVGRMNNNAVYDKKKGVYRKFSPYAIRGFSDVAGVALPGVLPKGTFLAVECKDQDGHTSPEQRTWLTSVAKSGNTAILARCMDDVRVVIQRKAIPEPETGVFVPSGLWRMSK